ncbi:DUF6115 domain-containing protein [Gracilibacillus dipsosauri]|uniref:Swarming motility protein SwrB n=1 Tax=Gracilibacillus dipsosauri TaxID=178340 RepID=A0A317L044_9BACI|nr:hypothetical protein [Gracilibacillus dipsosauri]PWU68846.1 hypothetical protein DLJ74_10535 [Gracilibacillus dipsosauri]
MIYLLLLLSFLIHIITFIVIRHLKMKQQNIEDIEANVLEQVEKMEDSLALYLVEMKEENQKFLEQIDLMDNPSVEITEAVQQNQLKKKTTNEVPQPNKPEEGTVRIPKDNEYEDYQPITDGIQKDTVEQSLTAQILHLSQKGMTSDEIAKKLDKGKTEIELLLKFQQKNR